MAEKKITKNAYTRLSTTLKKTYKSRISYLMHQIYTDISYLTLRIMCANSDKNGTDNKVKSIILSI